MAEREVGGFGSMLRKARERRGISLRDIATTTKISFAALEALERNDISRLPGGIFSRAIVRSYALEVGLDPEQTTQDFVAQFPHESVTAGHPATTYKVNAEDNRAIEGRRQSASVFLWMFLISVPVAFGLVYLSVTGRPGEASSTLGGSEIPAPGQEIVNAAPVLSIVLAASAPCRIRVVADGTQTLDRDLLAGDRQSFDVKQDALLTVSDPFAVTLTLNGREARVPGSAGAAAVVTLTPSNYTEYLTAR